MVRFLDIDPHKCNGCMSCVIACAQKRGRIANPLLGRIQVMRWEDEGVNVPIVCMHCEDAPCQRVCPVDALIRDPASQVIRIDYDRCIGCRFCVEACPFGAMSVNPSTREVQKCDLCDGDPICIKFCHPQAIRYLPVTRAMYSRRRSGAQRMQEVISSKA